MKWFRKKWVVDGLVGIGFGILLFGLYWKSLGMNEGAISFFVTIFQLSLQLPIYIVKYVFECVTIECTTYFVYLSIVLVSVQFFLVGAIIGRFLREVQWW